MTEENSKTNGNKWTPIIVGVVAALLGSSGTLAIYLGTPLGQTIARPDPFTGHDAAELAHRIADAEIHIATHISQHPSDVDHYDRRITTLEVQFTQILENQDRILDHIEAH